MRKILTILLTLFMVLDLTAMSGSVSGERRKKVVSPDSVISQPSRDFVPRQSRRMSTSAYPVNIQVVGKTVKIQSDHTQILPVYSQTGAFYMVMRLTKGTNWLNGLPRGKYYINNKSVNID